MEEHLSTAEGVAAGLRVLPQAESAMASAMGAYRFYSNERVSLMDTFQPVKEYAAAAAATCQEWALVMHDWSPLHYTQHESKTDRIVLYNKNDFGYLLQAALLVSDQDGAPLAPLYLGVEAADGVHSTRREAVLPRRHEMDELNRTMGHLEEQALGKPLAHIIDRQADSLLHLRRFVRCGRRFIIRGNNVRRVEYEGVSCLLSEVELKLKQGFRFSREVEFKGRQARQYVAEATVTLAGASRQQRRRKGKLTYHKLAGAPLELRLILVEVRDQQGEVLATWRLWSNLPTSVSAETIALWYYWRWRIESYFKLLKSAGQEVEHWQQESAAAIAKRLVVAAQACVIVWALMASAEPEAASLRRTLVRLSGRLMKHKVEWTAPALLAGMHRLLMILDAIEQYPLQELRDAGKLLRQMLAREAAYG